ncbi:hypothetical protein WDW37_17450 [Bdellovibrionota bacterium FG-1]
MQGKRLPRKPLTPVRETAKKSNSVTHEKPLHQRISGNVLHHWDMAHLAKPVDSSELVRTILEAMKAV